MAVMSGMYAAYHGPEGIRGIAMNAFNYAHAVADLLRKGGYRLTHESFFDTIRIEDVNAADIKAKAEAAGINFYYPDGNEDCRNLRSEGRVRTRH